MTEARLRRERRALALSFLVQGAAFALLVTRIPAVRQQYGIPDALLPAYLAGVPVLAGLGSAATGALVARVPAPTLLRWAQPVVLLALAGIGAGGQAWHLGVALAVFGLAVGVLDASMNMLGVSLQREYGRSIMLGFHAAYSLGGVAGAALAWGGARLGLPLGHFHPPLVLPLLALALLAGRRCATGRDTGHRDTGHQGAGHRDGPGGRRAAGRVLLPLCLVMAFAYLGDATVSNWSATYLRDVLGGSEALATLPYSAYTATTLLGRAVGDLAVRRYGAVAVVRGGVLLASGGFAAVAAAPGPWTGIAGFTVLGLGLSVVVPQTFAAAGRHAAGHGRRAADAAVARLNVFTYAGVLVGSPLVGALGEAWSPRWAMAVPPALLLAALPYTGSFAGHTDRYGGGHERSRTVDVG
ncbi:MFS transporter [Streptomyces roseolilacinus]|uniref:MFS transporter n=1 Tax=Streptomyces roseolilacinus TaxID=66904 RepID=A0A918AYS3_9ACTN|nr:MFS transporter [Streptomyces roseolilacinus]GGP92959.1 MFS transporter [Streptomyces roseolilacinus]